MGLIHDAIRTPPALDQHARVAEHALRARRHLPRPVPLDTRIGLRFSDSLRVDTVTDETVRLSSARGELRTNIVVAEEGRLAFRLAARSARGRSEVRARGRRGYQRARHAARPSNDHLHHGCASTHRGRGGERGVAALARERQGGLAQRTRAVPLGDAGAAAGPARGNRGVRPRAAARWPAVARCDARDGGTRDAQRPDRPVPSEGRGARDRRTHARD